MSCNSPCQFAPPPKPLLIVLSGLSGAGKDAVLARLKESDYPLKFITTVTTRPRRNSEREGVDYYFVSRETFQEMITDNKLLEWANVYGNFYGVPRQPVKDALASGQDAIVKVDVQGAATIKKILPQAVFIFLAPPSLDDVIQRLKKRQTESPTELELRLKTAEAELKQIHLFDYVVVNRQDAVDHAVAEIKAIITAEKCRVVPHAITL